MEIIQAITITLVTLVITVFFAFVIKINATRGCENIYKENKYLKARVKELQNEIKILESTNFYLPLSNKINELIEQLKK